MTQRWTRWMIAATVALTIPVAGPRAGQPADPLTTEIRRWLSAVESEADRGALWTQVKPGAQVALVQAQSALVSGRRSFALERLAAARALLAAAQYVGERPPEVRTSVTAFEAEWARMGTSLGAALVPPAGDALRALSSSAARALAEVAALQVKVNYDASLIYGRATDADSGLFYLGAAQAQQAFVSFARSLPAGAIEGAPLRSLETDAAALERRLLALYQPPASIDRHAEFIAASAALKEARELDRANLRYGAWLKFLQATQRTAMLQATAVPGVDTLRARLAGVDREMGAKGGDQSLVRVFLDRVAMELEKPTPDAAGLAASAAILDSVVPAYSAAMVPAAPTASVADASVTVRLVRWPFT